MERVSIIICFIVNKSGIDIGTHWMLCMQMMMLMFEWILIIVRMEVKYSLDLFLSGFNKSGIDSVLLPPRPCSPISMCIVILQVFVYHPAEYVDVHQFRIHLTLSFNAFSEKMDLYV